MSKYADAREGFEAGQKSRPSFCEDGHLEFLDDLQESGATNMMGATRYLMTKYDGLFDKEAAAILSYWMKTFGESMR